MVLVQRESNNCCSPPGEWIAGWTLTSSAPVWLLSSPGFDNSRCWGCRPSSRACTGERAVSFVCPPRACRRGRIGGGRGGRSRSTKSEARNKRDSRKALRFTRYERPATHEARRFTQLRFHPSPPPRPGSRRHRFVWKKARQHDFALDKTAQGNTLRANNDAPSYCAQTVRGLTGYEAWMLCVCLEQGLFSPLISKRLARPVDVRLGRNPSDSWVAQAHPWRLSQRCASKPAFRSRCRCKVPRAVRSSGVRRRPVVETTGGKNRGLQTGRSRPS